MISRVLPSILLHCQRGPQRVAWGEGEGEGEGEEEGEGEGEGEGGREKLRKKSAMHVLHTQFQDSVSHCQVL